MKKVLILCATLVLSGCGLSEPKCLQAAQAEMPGADIVNVPGKKFRFIAKDGDGSVWYLETMNYTDTNVTAKVRLFKAEAK